ncbi:hypothetical protein BU26DRAFT_586528 [Trematosphaeria pertusa]|uniref:Uncharacterized protein n=1 Tax=Trematosphaeria pertusa TaxID=390896 RepID=A0A6A6HSH3_9PLEO|nr:uncharacterized protein BU26DRAFT_586528 [Trematosphaeria pertusa]KAF2240947.1 hypothetical protein BU26DRAFT_586528 [Trematosphaeria pertusa]
MSNKTVAATNATIPAWIPSGFQVSSGNTHCPNAASVLTHFAIYNAISIGTFLLLGSYHVKRRIKFWLKPGLRPWKFWSAAISVIMQILGIIITSLLIRRSGYKADLWQLIQIWAIRPRVSWFIGNMLNIKRSWGYMNGALDNVVVEVFICGLGCVFVGRLARQALTHANAATSPQTGTNTWYIITCVASIVMLLSTAFEILWALWVLKRVVETKGKAEAQDIDSLKWIVRFMIPLTYTCSFLIWAAFLNSTEGAYCPGNVKYVDLTWGLIPAVTNLMRIFVEV